MKFYLKDNKLRLKLYKFEKLPRYNLEFLYINLEVLYLKALNSIPIDLRKYLDKDDILKYFKSTSFSIKDEDLFINNARVFIDNNLDIFLGRVDYYDIYVKLNLASFIISTLLGILEEVIRNVMNLNRIYSKQVKNNPGVYIYIDTVLWNISIYDRLINKMIKSVNINKFILRTSYSYYEKYRESIDEFEGPPSINP